MLELPSNANMPFEENTNAIFDDTCYCTSKKSRFPNQRNKSIRDKKLTKKM